MAGIAGGGGGDALPSGVITMWSGTTADVPDGWTLCDGTDGTPDLRDRFVAGAGAQYAAGETGGSDSVQLTEQELPTHDHTGTTSTDGAHTHDYGQYSSGGSGDITGRGQYGSYPTQQTSSDGDHSHTFTTDDAGGDQAHENRPPYLALAFIMKT
ncbi:hypothetical protein [Halobaculum lipolyticum]|uniref:Tail fiber protein n=1 Tax=Halobaculum lipolyticum TaxID=3032001 RepID=A0ABD5WC21_9EURY|nr:hypothetical protein [Halobaculum sp. DT31]